jgi:hypothetical protein
LPLPRYPVHRWFISSERPASAAVEEIGLVSAGRMTKLEPAEAAGALFRALEPAELFPLSPQLAGIEESQAVVAKALRLDGVRPVAPADKQQSHQLPLPSSL